MNPSFKKSILIFSILFFLSVSSYGFAGKESYLLTSINKELVQWGGELRAPWGIRLKIEVNETNIYRITYEDLAMIGFYPDQINPIFLQLENQGRPISYLFEGDSDEVFEPGESILFYGEEISGDYLSDLYHYQSDYWPEINGWQPRFSAYMIEKYTDTNVYWLFVSEQPGLQIVSRDGTPGEGQSVTSFRDIQTVDEENIWWTPHFTSEDTWFQGFYNVSTFPYEQQYSITLIDPLLDGNQVTTITGQFISATSNNATTPDHHLKFFLNEQLVSDDYWDGAVSYEFTGEINQQFLNEGLNEFSFVALSQGLPVSRYAFNHFSINYQRKLNILDGKLIFQYEPTEEVTYNISGLDTSLYYLWDVSDPLHPIKIENAIYEENLLKFGDIASSMKKFIILDNEAPSSVTEKISLYHPVDLLSPEQQSDYIIISPSLFIQSSQILANYRASQGYQVRIIDIEDIYNQFNFGISHPIAIKNFFGYVYHHWQKPAPQYVLLVGDGHWDIKNLRSHHEIQIPPNFVWVDPVQGEVDSLSDLVTVSGYDILPDAMIGRLPVNDVFELENIIQKIIQFENASGAWLNNLTFVADNYYLQDPDSYPACIDENPITLCPTDPAGNFPTIVTNLISTVLEKPYQIKKIFLDDYDCRSTSLDNCELVTNSILEAFQEGNQFITFSGHGAMPYWTTEKVFHVNHIPALTNNDRNPVVFSLDCVDGYWYFPPDLSGDFDRRSLAEELLRANNNGAVAVYSSPGNGYLNGHELLLKGFYAAFTSGKNPTLGELDQSAKLNLMNDHGNENLIYSYMIFGDPALRLHPIEVAIFLPLVTK